MTQEIKGIIFGIAGILVLIGGLVLLITQVSEGFGAFLFLAGLLGIFYGCYLNKKVIFVVIGVVIIGLIIGFAFAFAGGNNKGGCSICGSPIYAGSFCKKHFNNMYD